MSDEEFYCHHCHKWKKISCRSERKYAKSWMCSYCDEKLQKRLHPDGKLSRLTPEHLDNGRANARKRRAKQAEEYAASWRAEELSKKLRGS